MKKFAFIILSILLAAVLLVVALPIVAFAEAASPYVVTPPPTHAHIFEEYSWEEKVFFSVDWHEVATHTTERCAVCGILSDNETIRYHLEDHDDIIVGSDLKYEYVTNEYHDVIECTVTTYQCCGNTMLTIPDYSTAVHEDHEIDPSVDQETEMEGACIHCGKMISW